MQRLVWPINVDAELYTTCPGDRTVARKSSIGGIYVRAWRIYIRAEGAWHSNLTKISLSYSVSYFHFGGIGALFGGLNTPKPTNSVKNA